MTRKLARRWKIRGIEGGAMILTLLLWYAAIHIGTGGRFPFNGTP